jgi:solute carrier family 30 (zinc transporter), member 1
LILVVGSAGLASNMVGLALFHEHSHGHGEHSHSHAQNGSHTGHTHNHDLEAGESSHSHTHTHTHSISTSSPMLDEGPVEEVLPETVVRRASSPKRVRTVTGSSSKAKAKRRSRRSFASADDIYVSPAANRQSILTQAEEIRSEYNHESDEAAEDGFNGDTIATSEPSTTKHLPDIPHHDHNHAKAKDSKKSGHGGHGNLNMKGVFLHVLGDALGNIGVIITALFIWLTDFSWRFYSDPIISLVITAIIFSSALPLVKSASLILLQGVPRGISLDDVKEDILGVQFPSNSVLTID